MAIKTLHITNSYHPASGGIRTFYHALLEAANRHRRYVRLVVPGPETAVEEAGEFGRIYHVAAPHVSVIDSRYRWMLPHVYAWPYDSPLRRILAAERHDLVEVCDKFWLLYLSGALRRQWIPGVPVPVIVGLTCERLDDNMRAYVSAGWAAQRVCESYMRKCYVPRFDFHLAASDYIATEVRGFFQSACAIACAFARWASITRRSVVPITGMPFVRNCCGGLAVVKIRCCSYTPGDCRRKKICWCCRKCWRGSGSDPETGHKKIIRRKTGT